MSKYRGIDVSNWSGTIDWEDVANSGVEVVIIQVSEGIFYRNPYSQEFYDGAKRNNLKVGFYHFFNPGSSPTPVEQARYFVDAISGLHADIKLVLDLEQTGGLGNYELTKQAIEDLVELNGLSNPYLIYTGKVLKIESSGRIKDGNGFRDYYVVQKGDTLLKIDKKFNKTEKDLLENNNLTSDKELYKGHVIRLN